MKKHLCLVLVLLLVMIGCSNQKGGELKHPELVYEAAEQYVTFSHHIPYFQDYTIVQMMYTPPEVQYEVEEVLFITYNANIFVTPDMQAAIGQANQLNVTNVDSFYTLYGPFYKPDQVILPINVLIKQTPFDVISHPNKANTELYTLEVEGKEIVYDYNVSVMTSHGNHAYFVFAVEHEGIYYRVRVEITSHMTEEEVKEKIIELSSAIFL